MEGPQKLTNWIDWYRFARQTLALDHTEAVTYANARYVEEQNRRYRASAGAA